MRNGQRVETRTHDPAYFNALSERALVECCQSGDPDAWNTLFHRYARSVYNDAYALCRDRDEANDIVGQVFLHLYQHLNTYRKQATFRIWLLAIVRNTFIDQCIRPAHRKNLSLDATLNGDGDSCGECWFTDPAPSPEALCMQRETARLLAGAVRDLPRNQRMVLDMYYTEGKSYNEIAAETRVSLGTVKARMHRARIMLRERLTPSLDASLFA
jgi:RNA polymerase sigma-70 factor (ECF subfamily)